MAERLCPHPYAVRPHANPRSAANASTSARVGGCQPCVRWKVPEAGGVLRPIDSHNLGGVGQQVGERRHARL